MKYVQYFNNHPTQKKILLFLSWFCVLLSFVGYVSILGYLVYSKQYTDLFKTFIIPLSTIIIVEVIRHFYSRPRPFETGSFKPLIDHEPGRSFPSKHATSAMIITLSIYRVFPILGLIFIFNTLIVGLTRIFSGIHHLSDVCGGFILAFLMSLFYVL